MATGTVIDVVMPQMGVSVSEGTITKWLKREGEHIEADGIAFFEAARARSGEDAVDALDWGLEHRAVVLAVFLAFALASLGLYPFVGRDFFPTVDAGQL